MKAVGLLVVACVVLSVIQSVTVAAALVLGTMLLWGAFFRPYHVAGLLTFELVAGLLDRYPLGWVGIGILVFTGLIAGSFRGADE